MDRRRRERSRWVPPLALALAAAAASAELPREQLLQRVAEGRCPSALPALRAQDPGRDLSLWWARALCENATGESAAALEAVRSATALGLGSAELALQEGIAHFQLGDLDSAREALGRAAEGDASPPERLLFEGLVALAQRRPAEASQALERARRLDPVHVEPVASYYMGRARAELGEAAEAREILARVQREWPDTPWAEQAGRALTRLEPDGPRPWLSLEIGGEYDDNAVLRGAGVRLPSEIPGQRDHRLVWRAHSGAELFRRGPWAAGGLVEANGWLHDQLHDFDTTEPLVSVWLDRALRRDTLARLELTTAYAWVDGDPFRSSHAATATLLHAWNDASTTSVRVGLRRDDYRFDDEDVPDGIGRPGAPCLDPAHLVCSPPGLDESRERNRDGQGSWIGALHELRLGEGATAWGGYRYQRYAARGSEYSFDAHEWEVGLRVALPARFDLEASGHYARRAFRHESTFPEPDALIAGREYGLDRGAHREREVRTRLVLGRDLGRRLRVEARWIHERARSNVSVFDYRRDQFGGFVILALGHVAGDPS